MFDKKQLQLIYTALLAAACLSRQEGHDKKADRFFNLAKEVEFEIEQAA